MKGWYCSSDDKRLRYGDNRLIRRGITHKMKWPYRYVDDITDKVNIYAEPTLCKAGLHASKDILTAFQIGSGLWIWRVEVTGRIAKGEDKFCGGERKYLWGLNVSDCWGSFSEEELKKNLLKYVRREALKKGYIKKGERL
jgi:hypothetical protein